MPTHHRHNDRASRRALFAILLPLLGALTLQGCGAADTPARPDRSGAAAPAEVSLSTDDPATGIYPIEAEPTVPSGAVTFTVDNPGKTERGAQVMRVDTGHDAADAFLALKEVGDGGPMPAWLEWAGGVGVVRPGHHYVFSVELKPGRYYVVDRSFEGKPSDFANIDTQARLDVIPAAQPAALPAATGSISANADGFTPDGLSAGSMTVLLRNNGAEPHNFVLPILERHSDDLFVGVRVEGFDRQSAFAYRDSLACRFAGALPPRRKQWDPSGPGPFPLTHVRTRQPVVRRR